MEYYGNNDWRDYLAHYGVSKASGAKVGSGRYPLGSGKNPNQGSAKYYTPKRTGGDTQKRVLYSNPSGMKRSLADDLASLSGRELQSIHIDTSSPFPEEFPNSHSSNSNGFFFRKKVADTPKKYKAVPGLKLKTREYTLEEDIAAVNPKGGDQNCMLCTTAFELRRRGHDVSAKVSERGYPAESLLEWYNDIDVNLTHRLRSWEDYFRNVEAATSARGNVALEKAVTKDLRRDGIGARGNLMVRLSLYSGHSVAYEVTKKGVKIYDTQQNQTYTEDESKKILRRVLGAEYARTDTAEFNDDAVKQLVDNRLTDTPEDYTKPGVRFRV